MHRSVYSILLGVFTFVPTPVCILDSSLSMSCRYGKEDKLVNLFGIMQAIVSFIQDDSDNLRSIVAGSHRFVFMCRGPLVFVSVSRSRQSDTQVIL